MDEINNDHCLHENTGSQDSVKTRERSLSKKVPLPEEKEDDLYIPVCKNCNLSNIVVRGNIKNKYTCLKCGKSNGNIVMRLKTDVGDIDGNVNNEFDKKINPSSANENKENKENNDEKKIIRDKRKMMVLNKFKKITIFTFKCAIVGITGYYIYKIGKYIGQSEGNTAGYDRGYKLGHKYGLEIGKKEGLQLAKESSDKCVNIISVWRLMELCY